jgi:hypothetical protein
MVSLRSSLLAVSLTTAVVSATASSHLQHDNSTTTHSEERSLLEYDPRIFSMCGVDLVGGDTWVAQYPEPDLCVTNCRADKGCDAATWTPDNGGTCYFKRMEGSYANAVPKVGAISFMRDDDPSTSFKGPAFPDNVDMPGNDGTHYSGSTIEECYRAYRLSAYVALTWTDYQGGTCWLKTKVSPYVYSPGAISRWGPRNFNPNYCL